MLRNNIQLGDFIAQLKTLLLSVVVKRDKLADAFETDIDAKKAADKYINTIDNGDDWNSYVKFDREVLLMAGLDANMISYYMANKDNIPREMRGKVVAIQKQYIIDNYVEKNDYYRMLHGEPTIEDEEAHEQWEEEQRKEDPDPKITDPFIYCGENTYGIPSNVPVHQLSNEYISLMEAIGILDTMKAENPTKGYLKYLGKKAISYYNARTADNFGLLYVDTTKVDNVIREDFITFYDKARSYYMIGFYNREFSNIFVWYDEFIGLLTLIMATQRLISNIYKQGLTRDFYDVNLIKYLFNSYSIPFIEELDIKYQRALAKNLNYLLQYKSTDKVLYDISYLLGFYNVNIYKYYLIKTHKLKEDGSPIFEYKTYKENGETVTVPDYPKMYGFHFQQVNLKSEDINSAIIDQRFHHDYEDIIDQDPYWVEDAELKQRMYEEDFNHIVTKYMSVDVMVKMVEMIYEVSHTMRAVIDNKEDFRKIMINIPAISPYDITLYDYIILLCALISKKLHLPGKIPLVGYQIANVYGFNYSENLEVLRQAIYNTKDLTVGEILYAEDDLTFYEVQPGPKIELPNHFKNELTGENTYDSTTLEKNAFKPLTVNRIYEFPAEPVEGAYYAYYFGKPMMFVYRQTTFEATRFVPYRYTEMEVTRLPKYGKPYICYIVIPSTAILYRYTKGSYEELEYTAVGTLGYNLIDNSLAAYITNMRAVTARDLGEIYKSLKTLRLFITKMLDDTNDIDVYYQYQKLYKALLITEDVESLYVSTNGDVCKTYADLLEKNNPDLYTIYQADSDNDTDLNNHINALFSKLASYGDYKFLANVNRSDSMFDTVLKLIRFFKSYTVDFINSGIQYVFDDSYLQGLKLIDECIVSGSLKEIDHSLFFHNSWYKDMLNGIRPTITIKDINHVFHDDNYLNAITPLFDRYFLDMYDKLWVTKGDMNASDRHELYDDISFVTQNLMAISKYRFFKDQGFLKAYIDDRPFKDKPDIHDRLIRTIDFTPKAEDLNNYLYNTDNIEFEGNRFIKDRNKRFLRDGLHISVDYLG